VRANNNGVGIEFSVHGGGRPVTLLHGWPDSAALWRHQIPALADAGFQVIVPDLRGFGASDAPDAVDAYAVPHLAADVLAVLESAGVEQTHLVGHDWGAALAWALASFAPERVDHLVVLSVGHPSAFHAAGLPQREKSWYMLLFQFAGIAEQWLSKDDWANLGQWARHPDHDRIKSDLARPGRLTASLNWYRANVPPQSLIEPAVELPPVAAPTMGVWSSGDIALTEAQMTGSASVVKGPWRYERIDGAGHWMQLEVPATLNRLLVDFLPA
jgi:pimeloyl-ACP methyl ester carboxylesterase